MSALIILLLPVAGGKVITIAAMRGGCGRHEPPHNFQRLLLGMPAKSSESYSLTTAPVTAVTALPVERVPVYRLSRGVYLGALGSLSAVVPVFAWACERA